MDDLGALIKQARLEAGLSQRQLARMAGTAQSAVAAYESDSKRPSLGVLRRLLRAAGCDLDLRVTRLAIPDPADPGRLRARLFERRDEVMRAVARCGATRVRVFGSVARGDHTVDSDIDLLIDLPDEADLVDRLALTRELGQILDARVDVVRERNLSGRMAAQAESEIVPL